MATTMHMSWWKISNGCSMRILEDRLLWNTLYTKTSIIPSYLEVRMVLLILPLSTGNETWSDCPVFSFHTQLPYWSPFLQQHRVIWTQHATHRVIPLMRVFWSTWREGNWKAFENDETPLQRLKTNFIKTLYLLDKGNFCTSDSDVADLVGSLYFGCT